MNTLGNKIKELRKMQGLTQQDLATLLRQNFGLGTDRAMISKWETGFQIPEMYTVACLSKLFDVSIDYLNSSFHESNVPTPFEQDRLHLSKDAFDLLKCYSTLNASGKEEAQKRVSELAEIPRYTNTDDSTDTTLAIAALGGDGVKFKNIPVRDKEDVLGILKKRKEKENNK